MKAKLLVNHVRGVFLIALLSFTLPTSAQDNYRVGKATADDSIPQTEALFKLRFKVSEYQNEGRFPLHITYSCNGVIHKIPIADMDKPHEVCVSPGIYTFKFYYSPDYLEVFTGSIEAKASTQTEITVYFRSAHSMQAYPEKPVIYLYPTKAATVEVKLNVKGKLMFSYPPYKDGWKGTAYPNGTLKINDKEHHYLFWDGKTQLSTQYVYGQEGYVVNQKNVLPFLEEKLSEMGLNSSEKEDFITYWGPKLSTHRNTRIQFLFNETYDEIATLHIQPKPDNLYRVFMLWQEVNTDVLPNLKPQFIPTIKREGFTVVEWGGAQIEETLSVQANKHKR